MLIGLGVSIEAFLELPVVLQKASAHQLAYSYLNDTGAGKERQVIVNTETIPYFLRIKCELIAGKIKILYQRHQVLFESAYHYECINSAYLGQLFFPRLEKAFKIIKNGDQKLYETIVSALDYIVPLANPGKNNHPSFASALLKRTIFLSLDLLETNDHYLAECIIHEFGHCQLYKVQDTILLTQTDLTERYYYSPWRTDPRHLLGLVHGIYVFSAVIKFYQHLIAKNSMNAEISEWVENRITLLLHQVSCAIRQIREDEIAPAGKMLTEAILSEMQDIASAYGIDLNILHRELADHQDAWRSKNSAPEFIIK